MAENNRFDAFVVEKNGESIHSDVVPISKSDLPTGDVTVEVAYSSINFKDALAATGNPGVAKAFPIVPGIDAVGRVVECQSASFKEGDLVHVADARFGTEVWGGWTRFVRVPEAWVYPVPDGLSLEDTIALGTAGFTAAQCILALEDHGANPDQGEFVVTGATGGVGCLSVMMLAQLGYQVVASTGKLDRAQWLTELGAARVVARDSIVDVGGRPLLSAQWGGAVDTVGGDTLASVIRATKPHGCVTACGVVGGPQLSLTVFPFILRGVALQGIDSAGIDRATRIRVWSEIAQRWDLSRLKSITQVVGLKELDEKIKQILAGQIAGRVVVDPAR